MDKVLDNFELAFLAKTGKVEVKALPPAAKKIHDTLSEEELQRYIHKPGKEKIKTTFRPRKRGRLRVT